MMLTSSERSPSNSSLPTTAVSRVAVSAGIGGPAKAAARIYFPELLPDVLDGRIDPGRLLAHAGAAPDPHGGSGEQQVQGRQVRQQLVLADVGVLRPGRVWCHRAGMAVPAPVRRLAGPILSQKFPIADPMYWSNSWAGAVLIALAAAGLAAVVLRRPARR
jgi:hypothetical protein